MPNNTNSFKITTFLNVALILGVGIIAYWTRHIESRLERIENQSIRYVTESEIKDIKRDILDRLSLTEKAIETRLERINVIFDQLNLKIDCILKEHARIE